MGNVISSYHLGEMHLNEYGVPKITRRLLRCFWMLIVVENRKIVLSNRDHALPWFSIHDCKWKVLLQIMPDIVGNLNNTL